MIDLLTITNDPDLAARADQLHGMRLFVDLERQGKAERQAGLNTFISTHCMDDVGRIKRVLRQSKLMVRVNPCQLDNVAASKAEVDEALAQGADLIMLPMFTNARQLQTFADMVDGRAPIVSLLETADALETLDAWLDTPGLHEVYVGLNDLHLSLGCRFMFDPLRLGHVERVAVAVRARGIRFGFGGIARASEGLLPGRDVLAEHLRLGSQAVILSRTFNRTDSDTSFEDAVAELRKAERALMQRQPSELGQDHLRIARLIERISGSMPPRA